MKHLLLLLDWTLRGSGKSYVYFKSIIFVFFVGEGCRYGRRNHFYGVIGRFDHVAFLMKQFRVFGRSLVPYFNVELGCNILPP